MLMLNTKGINKMLRVESRVLLKLLKKNSAVACVVLIYKSVHLTRATTLWKKISLCKYGIKWKMNNSSFHEHKNHKITKTITNKTNEKNVHTVRFLLCWHVLSLCATSCNRHGGLEIEKLKRNVNDGYNIW